MSDMCIKSARRALEILEYFDEARTPLSLKSIAEHFGYPVSSASGLLKSLVVLGYVDYDRFSRTYMPTTRVASLGQWIPNAVLGDGDLINLMTHLNILTNETVVLGAQSDLFAQYVHVVPTDQPNRNKLKAGTIRPLNRSGIGIALLTMRSDSTIDILLRRINIQADNPADRMQLSELMPMVNEARRSGYAFSRGTIVKDHGMIAMVLPLTRHGRYMAIGVGGPVERLEARKDFILSEMRRGMCSLQQPAAEPAPETWPSGNAGLLGAIDFRPAEADLRDVTAH